MVKVTISSSSKETGQLLINYLKSRDLYDPKATACVCYGLGGGAHPALNTHCSSNKIERLNLMAKEGVPTVPWSESGEGLRFPLLARNTSGFGGTDIVAVFQSEELPWRRAAGFGWFSEYIPIQAEYRVWVFRGQHLGTYSKVMRRPGECKFIGRNFRNGFDFQPHPEIKSATQLAVEGIRAVGLDFAAVDMLLGKDGKLYILELNTAPGVIKSGAQKSLENLVGCVEKWVKGGYPSWE